MKESYITYDDVKLAAELLRKYAKGIETRLYMDMKITDAHHEIAEAYRIANELDQVAEELDTISPTDLG